MDFQILTLSSYARRFLKACAEGSVHSVYKKTINFILDRQLLALQAADSPLSPLSLIANLKEYEMGVLPISVRDRVAVSESRIHIGSVSFSFSEAKTPDTYLYQRLSEEELVSLISRIQTGLSRHTGPGLSGIFQASTDSEPPALILDAARHYASTARDLFRIGDFKQAASELTRFIGLGPGLTPSGDDFLCGIFAGLMLRYPDGHPFQAVLREAVSCHLSGTNDISSAFLRCAFNGQFSQAVISLATLPSSEALSQSFLALGHSSGLDTLCGIYYALTLSV